MVRDWLTHRPAPTPSLTHVPPPVAPAADSWAKAQAGTGATYAATVPKPTLAEVRYGPPDRHVLAF